MNSITDYPIIKFVGSLIITPIIIIVLIFFFILLIPIAVVFEIIDFILNFWRDEETLKQLKKERGKELEIF